MANLFELIKQKFTTQPYIEDSNAEWDKSMALEARKAQDEAQFAQKMQRIQNNPNSLEARMYNFGNNLKDFNLGDALLGRQATPTDTMSADSNGLKITTSENPRIGGILRDITGGYQENRFTPASLENLGQNTLEGGRQKGFAYRLGEGLGSISRLANSPLGRGLIVGGLVTATGGNPLQALAYGGGATMLNQQNVLKDQMYRKDLEDQGIDTSGIRGYMGDNVYGQLLRAKQLKDNAEYRKMYFDVNQANLQANREYQRQQDALDRAYQERAFNYKASQDAFDNKIALANLEAKQNKPTAEELKEQRQLKQANKTIDVMKQAYAAVLKNPNAFGFFKGVTGPDVTNRLDPQGVEARSLLESVTAEYTKYLTGVQASDAERKRYERFLPNPRDNAEIIQKKIKGMLNVIATREGVEIPNLEATEVQNANIPNVDLNAVEAELRKRGVR